ncbi:hypothetical protein Tsubulata_048064 [Turnera subulata]|uniref:Amino acid transporter transmembrane domain-containing protein n=1 Tax=Turnera subulata TaxID=218843 RepID=A0A9Q0FNC5_9ROSI|nr:hypothetical protein Tsubulata_048064 [Turnera subulata]
MSLAAGTVTSPLLPAAGNKPSNENRGSVPGAVFNVSTSILGAGIMSIPATLKVLGVIPALVLILVVAWLVDISVEFLMRYTHSGQATTYAGVMKEGYGKAGSVAVQVCVMMTNLGCLIMYLIIIGDVLSGKTHDGSVHLGVLQEWFGVHWWNSRTYAILFIVAYRITTVHISYISSPCVGVCWHKFGDGNIRSDTAMGAILNDIVRLSYALHLVLVFPLLNYSLRGNIDEFLFPRRPLLSKDTTRFVSLTLILLTFTYIAAIAIPNIWYVFQFMGSTSAVSLAFICPGAIVLRNVYNIATKRDKIIAAVMNYIVGMSPATGLNSPLLPDNHHKIEEKEKGTASLSGAVFNVSTSIIGAGIMSIPATLKVLGVIPAFVLVMVIAWLAYISVEFLMRFTHAGEATTYGGVMREAFGPVGSMAVQEMYSQEQCMKDLFTWVFCKNGLGFIGGTLVLLQCSSSAISVLLALVFVGISSGMAIYAIVQGNTKTPRMLPQLDDKASFFNLFTAVPVSLVLCAAIYFAIGIFGYLLFGESTMSDILVNFDQSSDTAIGALLNDIVRLSYAFHLMPVFPLLNFSLRGNIDEFLFPNKPALAKDTARFLSLTLSLLALIYVAAIAIPNIWYVFQFVGSTAAVSIAFIFPGAIVLRDVYKISTLRDRIMAAVMIFLAVRDVDLISSPTSKHKGKKMAGLNLTNKD